MEPRLEVITLAVADLGRALAFYRALGLESKGVVGTEWADERTGANGAVAMFKLDGGLLLNLYPRADLAKDAAIPVGPPQSGEFSLAQLVRSRGEVDEYWRTRRPRAPRSRQPTSGRGGSTPATSTIPMATFGRSSGTRTEFRNRAAESPPRSGPSSGDPPRERRAACWSSVWFFSQ